MRNSLFILSVCVSVLLGGASFVYPQTPDNGVEIIVDGMKYDTIAEYKHAQVKKKLTQALSSFNLQEFSEEELNRLLLEVRTEQIEEASTSKIPESEDREIIEEDTQGLNPLEMQESSDHNLGEQGEADNYQFDPGLVKDVYVNSGEQAAEVPAD